LGRKPPPNPKGQKKQKKPKMGWSTDPREKTKTEEGKGIVKTVLASWWGESSGLSEKRHVEPLARTEKKGEENGERGVLKMRKKRKLSQSHQ